MEFAVKVVSESNELFIDMAKDILKQRKGDRDLIAKLIRMLSPLNFEEKYARKDRAIIEVLAEIVNEEDADSFLKYLLLYLGHADPAIKDLTREAITRLKQRKDHPGDYASSPVGALVGAWTSSGPLTTGSQGLPFGPNERIPGFGISFLPPDPFMRISNLLDVSADSRKGKR